MASIGGNAAAQSIPPPPYSRTFSLNDSTLPDYTCTIFLSTTALLKAELIAPWRASGHRSWKCVHSKLQGTRLVVTSTRRSTSLGLQGAEVGLASDYYRRSNVVRIRAEGWQFLLALPSMAACIEWIEKITEAISISPPLEDWVEPGYPKQAEPNVKVRTAASRDELQRQWRERWRRRSRSQTWLRLSSQDQPCPGSDVIDELHRCSRSKLQQALGLSHSQDSIGTATSGTERPSDEMVALPHADAAEPAVRERAEMVKGCGSDAQRAPPPAGLPRSVPWMLYGSPWNKAWNQSPRTEELVKSWRPRHFSACICPQCAGHEEQT
ncbi:uncharacterized protein LTR77_003660 [Saxophila tyrrhenica]|uniref:PH domain-containing protein n=1 Tax=Saxophila tyrrhenica TaxID=1690608 RepID=A0AAV9PEE4_9PEZI|nr:hypothetical protein LTR77_003660 [Saxophila tyrrhenica]